jgi:hypothetical protein
VSSIVRCELAIVSRAMTSRLRSAASVRYALAVSPIKLIRVAFAASTVEKYAWSWASDRLRSRPNTSISHAASPTFTPYSVAVDVSLSAPLIARAVATEAATSIDGNDCARWMRYCARAASMLSAARRRSRLCASAWSITCASFGSRTNWRHGRSTAFAVPAPPARFAGIGAAGRW